MNLIADLDKWLASVSSGVPDETWADMKASALGHFLKDMKKTKQNPHFHAEGNVLNHTKLVVDNVVKDPSFAELSTDYRRMLFLAAVLHDIGKIKTTVVNASGRISSHHHAKTGGIMARNFLWKECGLAGTKEKVLFRETVCSLINWHMVTLHLISRPEPDLLLRKAASRGELIPDFTLEFLYHLAVADIYGRICDDEATFPARVEFAQKTAEEGECLKGPYHFANHYTKRAYFSGRNILPWAKLKDDTWGEVIVMSGLPGSGKDSWILKNHPELPVISLEKIRNENRIEPADPQDAAVQMAVTLAKEYLTRQQPFIWNSASTTKEQRARLITLLERYGASVRIVYVETDMDELLRRNHAREEGLPDDAVYKLLKKLEIPLPDEAAEVEWVYS